MDANQVVTIVSALGLVTVQVVAAVYSGLKLDQIHTLTNSNLTSVKKMLTDANTRIKRLEELLYKEKGKVK